MLEAIRENGAENTEYIVKKVLFIYSNYFRILVTDNFFLQLFFII